MNKKSILTSKKALAIGTLMASTLIAGCTTERQIRGFVIKEDLVQAVTPGLDNMVSVIDVIGSPSVRSTFDQNTWYYISSNKERKAFFTEEPVKQTVMVVQFDDRGIVDKISRYDLSHARSFEPNTNRTPTRGRELGFFEQIFGNIGRFAGPNGPQQGNAPIPQ